MKNKDIIKMIKNDSNKVEVPNLSKSIIENVERRKMFGKETTKVNESIELKPRFGLKPMRALLAVLIFALMIPALIIGVDLLNTDNGDIGGLEGTEPVKLSVSKTKESVGVQAASLFGFAEQNVFSSTIQTMSFSDDDYDDISSELNQYLFSIEELLSKTKNSYELYELAEGEYKYLMIIKVNSNGFTSEYCLYFNESATNQDYDDIDEVSSIINGYIECGEVKYVVTGIKEVENDECEIKLKLHLNENSFIIVEQEIERNENEYSFKYYKNQKIEKEVEISTEFENDKYTVELEVKKDGKKNEYKVKYGEDNNLSIEFTYDDMFGEVIVSIYEEAYEYMFGEDKKINHDRPDHHGDNQGNKYPWDEDYDDEHKGNPWDDWYEEDDYDDPWEDWEDWDNWYNDYYYEDDEWYDDDYHEENGEHRGDDHKNDDNGNHSGKK